METFPKYKNLEWDVCECVELERWRWIFLLNLNPELLGFDKKRRNKKYVNTNYFFSLGHVIPKSSLYTMFILCLKSCIPSLISSPVNNPFDST